MAYNAKKTDHAGAKKGRGAYYGRKAHAKKASSKVRRQRAHNEANNLKSPPSSDGGNLES